MPIGKSGQTFLAFGRGDGQALPARISPYATCNVGWVVAFFTSA